MRRRKAEEKIDEISRAECGGYFSWARSSWDEGAELKLLERIRDL